MYQAVAGGRRWMERHVASSRSSSSPSWKLVLTQSSRWLCHVSTRGRSEESWSIRAFLAWLVAAASGSWGALAALAAPPRGWRGDCRRAGHGGYWRWRTGRAARPSGSGRPRGFWASPSSRDASGRRGDRGAAGQAGRLRPGLVRRGCRARAIDAGDGSGWACLCGLGSVAASQAGLRLTGQPL